MLSQTNKLSHQCLSAFCLLTTKENNEYKFGRIGHQCLSAFCLLTTIFDKLPP